MMISVIMSIYNEKIYELKSSINSILNQTVTNIELIIIDDNPNYYILKKYLLILNKRLKKIKVYFNNKNLGAAKARNIGILHSSGDFIAIMDADDISKRNRFEKQLNFLKYNNLDFVFSNFKVMDINKDISKPVYHLNSIINRNYIKYLFSYYDNISLQSSWLIKREVFFKLKGYRDVIIEDYDFNIRAITYGYKLGYQNVVLLIKRERKNSITAQNYLKQYLTLKSIQSFIKHDNYHNIISLKNINKYTLPFITKNNINKFKSLIETKNKIKHKNNIIKSSIIFLYFLFTSKINFQFFIHLLVMKIRTIRVNKF